MNIDTLEQTLQSLVANPGPESFLYDLLLAYDQPKAAITRLQKGDYNLEKKRPNVVLWKQKLYYRYERHLDLHALIDVVKQDTAITRHSPRFIILTNMQHLVAVDTKTQNTLDIELVDLPKYFDFFLPWAGMEKQQFQSENPADVKAAERMGRLYDLIQKDNPAFDRHALNLFLSRLLFCFFAEDTGIFGDNQFTNAVGSHTAEDGSDLAGYLQKLFRVLALRERGEFPAFLQAFPYVNGGLFEKNYPVPQFSVKSRKLILECGALNWKAINPDIFGSMIQAVVHDEQRSHMGMHYTSVVNIMKVIEPLFLNELAEELAKAAGNEGKLVKLLDRLYHLRIFDPACGSGNFLIIAYKELCRLEIAIFRELQGLNTKWKTAKSGIRLTQFYGIELDDFAHETAKLSLWLTEHQMNMAFREVFGDAKPTLPLQSGGNIVCGNATRLNWETICPKTKDHETYILGNPPFYGKKEQTKEQKNEIKLIFNEISGYGLLDYVACWYFNALKMITGTKHKCAFVSTNSIVQGEQSSILWRYLDSKFDVNIFFAHRSFKWKNNARDIAGVYCVIIGLSNSKSIKKVIYQYGKDDTSSIKFPEKINNYLIDYKNIFISRRTSPLSNFPIIIEGITPLDDGILSFTEYEYIEFIKKEPESRKWFKPWVTGSSFINGQKLYCLWLVGITKNELDSLPLVRKKVSQVKFFRENSKSSQKFANEPWLFRETTIDKNYLIIPKTSSENRKYIPIGYVNDSITSSSSLILNNFAPWQFGVLSSHMHMTWMRTIAGRLKTDYRYSATLCYNTFPFPDISDKQKAKLEEHVFAVLDEREKHPEKTMAQLYDPDKMPDALRQAHHNMDIAIEQCYRAKPFSSDEERLEYLFKLYEEMIAKEKARG